MRNIVAAIVAVVVNIAMLAPFCEAAPIKVAVASNFRPTLEHLAPIFAEATRHALVISSASTGKLAAQIISGAPFDVFLAANTSHIDAVRDARALPLDAVFDFARGRLALLGATSKEEALRMLSSNSKLRFAIANPRFAPYGQAAMETLAALGLDKLLWGRLVVGENIAQAYQFVHSRNADGGLVALAQIKAGHARDYWPIPQTLHAPIVQRGILLRSSDATRSFVNFLRSDQARQIIASRGYDLP